MLLYYALYSMFGVNLWNQLSFITIFVAIRHVFLMCQGIKRSQLKHVMLNYIRFLALFMESFRFISAIYSLLLRLFIFVLLSLFFVRFYPRS